MDDISRPRCDWCLSEFDRQRPNQRFCAGGECRRAWHRENGRQHGIPGKVEYVRRLARGRMSITVRLSREHAERLRCCPGDTVRIVEGDS